MSGFTARSPHGYAVWIGEGKNIERDTLQCAHCAFTFYVTPGSGKKRGFCTRCAQVTCGRPECDPCIHWKKKHELIESGKATMSLITTGSADGLPVSASVPDGLPRTTSEIIVGK